MDKDVKCYIVNGDPWFRGKHVASILEYANTKKAFVYHVDIEHEREIKIIKG